MASFTSLMAIAHADAEGIPVPVIIRQHEVPPNATQTPIKSVTVMKVSYKARKDYEQQIANRKRCREIEGEVTQLSSKQIKASPQSRLKRSSETSSESDVPSSKKAPKWRLPKILTAAERQKGVMYTKRKDGRYQERMSASCRPKKIAKPKDDSLKYIKL